MAEEQRGENINQRLLDLAGIPASPRCKQQKLRLLEMASDLHEMSCDFYFIFLLLLFFSLC